MKRGDIVLVSVPRDYGKPRPALIIQSSLFNEHPSITICLITTHLLETPLFRYTVHPSPQNGLNEISSIQIDKIMTIPKIKVGNRIGNLSHKQMSEITKLLILWIGGTDP